MSEDLLTRVQTEADQCRNDGADDIARLLDEVAARLATSPAWIKHYAAMGMLDIRGKLYSEQVFSESGLHGAVGKVFRIEAGPETCVTLRDLTPLTMPRAQLEIIDRAADALNDAHLAMPPMSALAAHFNVNRMALKELRAALSVPDADRLAAEHDFGDSCCECAQCGKRFTDRGYKAHVSGQECARAATTGMALVPVEPTIEMQVAGFESDAWDALSDAVLAKKGWPYSCRQSAECVSAIWRAMLAAAPGTSSSAPAPENKCPECGSPMSHDDGEAWDGPSVGCASCGYQEPRSRAISSSPAVGAEPSASMLARIVAAYEALHQARKEHECDDPEPGAKDRETIQRTVLAILMKEARELLAAPPKHPAHPKQVAGIGCALCGRNETGYYCTGDCGEHQEAADSHVPVQPTGTEEGL